MVRLYSILLLVVVAAIVGLRSYGGKGLPFDEERVSCIKFRYSYEDSAQVVVRDVGRIGELISCLRVRPKKECMCLHMEEVEFTVDGEIWTASVCSHCFNLYRGGWYLLEMPPDFRNRMLAYRDSAHLLEPWVRDYHRFDRR